MSLSKLNHDCFLAILRLCPLPKQLYLRQVCISWCTTIESDCFHCRRSLALLKPNDPVYPTLPKKSFYYSPDPLHLKRTSAHSDVASLLLRLFPSVRKLLLFVNSESMKHISIYLSSLSSSLTSLAIVFSGAVDWTLLGRITTLKSLYCHLFVIPEGFPQLGVAKVMGRLEFFATQTTTFDVFRHLGSNLRWLNIGRLSYSPSIFAFLNHTLEETLRKLPEQTKSSLEHLSVSQIDNIEKNYSGTKETILQSFCCTFRNLKSFSLFDEKVI